MSSEHQRIFQKLAMEFDPREIRTRKQGGRDLRYITARVAMNRLDEVLGAWNWKDEYSETEKGIKCRISFRIPGMDEWLWKEDGGASAGMPEADNDEKSGYSDAFKRAAVKLGVARYLYNDGVPVYDEPPPPPPSNTPPARVPVVVNGEVVSEYRPSGQPKPENKGYFTKAHAEKTTEFLAWLEGQVNSINEKWHGDWEKRITRVLDDGGVVPAKVADVINKFKAKEHLLKWAKREGFLPPAVEPSNARSREVEAYLAGIFFGEGGKALIKAEMATYLKQERGDIEAAIYKNHPELAPDGYFDHDEPRATPADKGDAYEEPEPATPRPTPDSSGPRSGRALFAWIKDQEQRHEVGLLKYVNSWAKLQEFPGRMIDWDEDQVAHAYAEASRKLQSVGHSHAYAESVQDEPATAGVAS